MSWCDKLGTHRGDHARLAFFGRQHLWAAFAPILDKEVASEKPTFVITPNEPFSVGFQTDSGFHYAADQSKVVVGFQHRFRAKQVSGGHPEMEMLSRPMPFSLLLCLRKGQRSSPIAAWMENAENNTGGDRFYYDCRHRGRTARRRQLH